MYLDKDTSMVQVSNLTVALKTLIVIHRALREVDPTFREDLINYSRGRALMLNLSDFKDDSSPNACDYSAWVRTYALYLEEHLECFRILKYDVEKDQSITKELDTPDLLEHLPILQQLHFRLLACKPEGAAIHNSLIRYPLSIVASESVKLYVAITDGTLSLVDKYFEMQRHDAIRALEIYKKAESQNGAHNVEQVPSNPFDSAYHNQDPFYSSSNTALPSNVQMAVMSQEQAYLVLQQQQQQKSSMVGHDSSSTNPFGNPFEDQK